MDSFSRLWEALKDPDWQWVYLLSSTVLLAVVFWVLNRLTRVGTIARATLKEAVRQPIFLLVFALGTAIIGVNYYVPFFSMGDDTKIFVDCGLYTVLVSSILLAVWTASQSVAEEIEGRTAMTLLSKPIHRWQFVIGKYLGIVQSVLLLTVMMGAIFFVLTYFKYGYDARESGKGPVDIFEQLDTADTAERSREEAELAEASRGWFYRQFPWVPRLQQDRLNSAMRILPGLASAFMEASVLAAVSVMISTRLPMLVNIVTCFAVFVIGRLTPVLVESKLQDFPVVKFMANVIATILPGLDYFSMSTAISTDRVVPTEYLMLCGLYSLCYIAAAMLLALILFEDRDLA